MPTTLVNLELIRKKGLPADRTTKIICTLGPACWSVEGLTALIDAGMNVARFNFSHGDHAAHKACLERLHEASALRPNSNIGIMLDTKGPEIRTGTLDPSLGGKVSLKKGQTIEIGTDYERPGTALYLPCSYKSLPKSVSVGSKILVADGSLSLTVTEIRATSVMAEVMNNASFGEKKNMNLPGAVVDLPTLTEKDVDDLQNFGVRHGVDFIAASFVRKGSDIDFIRKVLGPDGAHIKIIAKIENQEGMENFDEILDKTDGIMVARGDLGMEIPIESVFLAQKMMISKCNMLGKPVVTATQMLESMITNPRPTRAECADVANAVLDGSDCVMLSGETANGEYPSDAVTMMASTCIGAESMFEYDKHYDAIRYNVLHSDVMGSTESIASSAVKTARDLGAKAIIVLSESGTTARLVAKYRPKVHILVVTNSGATARQVSGYMKGCVSRVVASMYDQDSLLHEAIGGTKELGWTKSGDLVVCVAGEMSVSGSTNMLCLKIVL